MLTSALLRLGGRPRTELACRDTLEVWTRRPRSARRPNYWGLQGTTSYTIGRAAPDTPATGFRRRGDFFAGDGRGLVEDAGVATLPAKRANCA